MIENVTNEAEIEETIIEWLAAKLVNIAVVVEFEGDTYMWPAPRDAAEQWFGASGPRSLSLEEFEALWRAAPPIVNFNRMNTKLCRTLIERGVPVYRV